MPSTPTPRPTLTDLIHQTKKHFTWPRPMPSLIATSSRGTIPHLTPENLSSHTGIKTVHIGLEDFLTPPAQNSAILQIPVPLHQYLAYPPEMELVLGPRRANPVAINVSWDNRIEIQTVDGRNPLLIETFVEAVGKLGLREKDTVIGVVDSTEAPGVKRLSKMVERTKTWLQQLLESNVSPFLPFLSVPALLPCPFLR